ncbi:beta-glucuronidase [Sneathia sp. DSM 16630]|uniref:Beta-glucuronidase n=1 Tax=Sneathia vaginalis TaxID=187101 RepID=A0A0E3ZAA8_9FUSO|nr:beta-glucuronidase [Sneathia vaginalis]AKC95791.1 beta-glucuronidase [Sneathia vaginalis]MBE2989567.1 beta-glucuronidase [Sneathia sp. DSM 16630]
MLYPLQTKTRDLIDLSGIWKFNFENEKEEMIAVPGSFNDQVVGHDKKNYVGNLIYQKDFLIKEEMLLNEIFLRFGSVTHVAKVYINNELVGTHKGGFTPFEFNINKYVKEGENRLKVIVSNKLDYTSLPVGNYSNENGQEKVDENFDFFNYAGIHRPVKLWIKPKQHIDDIVITYEVNKNNAKVSFDVKTNVENPKLKISILDEKNTVVSTDGVITNVRLWEPLNAYLYKAKVELLSNDGKVIDEYTEEFGIRTVEVRDNKFLINGKSFYFKGFGRHEDSYIHGRGLDEVLNVSDINRMKWLGANSFRTSHYPYSEEMMRLADREGFVVIDETTAVGLMANFGFDLIGTTEKKNTWEKINTKEAHEQVIRELIDRDKNYACVVMWSIANEPSTAEKGAYEYFEPLFKLARKLDKQKRPCTFANIMLAPVNKCLASSLCDVLCLNRYYGWYVNLGDLKVAREKMLEELNLWHEKYPNKPIMFTEYGVDTIAGIHDIDEMTPFSEEFQIEYYKMNEEVFDSLSYFIGEQTWNYADFQTKYGLFRVQGNKKGIFTRERNPKSIAKHLKNRWTMIPNYGYKELVLEKK